MTGHNTSSTSILVVYGDVPAFDQNGIITNYTITYRSLTEGHNGSAIAGPYDRQKELSNLREYVDYEITVLASTSKGDGPQSSPILVSTDEDSKYCSFPNRLSCFALCKVIWIPESRKFLHVESGILGTGIQNPAFGIQNLAKE